MRIPEPTVEEQALHMQFPPFYFSSCANSAILKGLPISPS
jgi:hypothetical protein